MKFTLLHRKKSSFTFPGYCNKEYQRNFCRHKYLIILPKSLTYQQHTCWFRSRSKSSCDFQSAKNVITIFIIGSREGKITIIIHMNSCKIYYKIFMENTTRYCYIVSPHAIPFTGSASLLTVRRVRENKLKLAVWGKPRRHFYSTVTTT